jgi:hypothetical protein
MATFSKKMMGKEVGDASVYAGRAKEAVPALAARKNMSSANTVNMSVGNIYRDPEGSPVKTSGIKMRGAGCATKGVMSRGPMA